MPAPGPSRPDRRSRRARVALLAAPVALLVAGCGAAAPHESASTASAVRRDVARALTSRGAGACRLRMYETRRLVDLETFSLPALEAAEERICRRDVGAFGARRVTLTGIEVRGNHATGRLVSDGGQFGFGELSVAFERDGAWKLDRITALRLDRAKFDAMERQLAVLGQGGLGDAQRTCAERQVERLSDAEVVDEIVRPDARQLVGEIVTCGVEPALRRTSTAPMVACVLGRLRAMGRDFLAVMLGRDAARMRSIFVDTGRDCGRSVAS